MRKIVTILTLLLSSLTWAQQLHIQGDALVTITQGANLEVTGDLENAGRIINNGILSLYGDWPINNIFDGLEGDLQFLGGIEQMIAPPSLIVNTLVVDQAGQVDILGDEFIITNDINFNNGIIKTGPNTRFVLEENARIVGGSAASYFQGRLTIQGSGIRRFPMGYEGVYAPITMLEVFGTDPELTVYFERPNAEQPIPDEDLLGVSGNGIWEVELSGGSINSTPVQIDFSAEDLEDFGIRNNIRHRVNSPVIAISDAPGGVFRSLGVESLENSDSLTQGSITTEIDFAPTELETAYFAIGLAPRIDPNGLVYIPQIFSPAATDPDNQTFRVFGEFILEDNFRLEIYNRFGSLVFSTTSWTEANQIGWNGSNQRTGNEEPSGLYYYEVQLTRISGNIENYSGPFYLQR